MVPEVELGDVEIDEDDLRIDTYRSQGAGGQHVNTSDSAVRITHLPTGIVVAVQNERSQLQNKNRAMQILAARLAEHARQQQQAEIDAIRGEQTEAGWGRQIRSYVLQPYQMVKDLRTDAEVGNVDGVLDGDLDVFMDAYLQWRRSDNGQSGEGSHRATARNGVGPHVREEPCAARRESPGPGRTQKLGVGPGRR